MPRRPIIPKCHACGRVESHLGWKALENEVAASEIYETLCRDCLAQWTDYLLNEIAKDQRQRDKVA